MPNVRQRQSKDCDRRCCTQNLRAHSALSHDGLHTSEPAPGAEEVQICRSRPLTGLEIYPEALLHQCGHKMLSHVDGVSSNSYAEEIRLLTSVFEDRPNAVRDHLEPHLVLEVTEYAHRSHFLVLDSSS